MSTQSNEPAKGNMTPEAHMTNSPVEQPTNECPIDSIPSGHARITSVNLPQYGTVVWFRRDRQWVKTVWCKGWNPNLMVYVLDLGVDLNTGTTSANAMPATPVPQEVREAIEDCTDSTGQVSPIIVVPKTALETLLRHVEAQGREVERLKFLLTKGVLI